MRKETGASRVVLWIALAATVVAIVLFAIYTLQNDPKTFVVLAVTIVLAWVVEAIWRAVSKRRMKAPRTRTVPQEEDQGVVRVQ